MQRFTPATIIALSLAVLAGGCYDMEEEYHLNPDGSGKVCVKITATAGPMGGMMGGNDTDPAASFAGNLIDSAQGVEAWKDVSWELLDDGRISLKGTAYFKDLSDLKLLGNEAPMVFSMHGVTDDQGVFTLQAVGPGGDPIEIPKKEKATDGEAPDGDPVPGEKPELSEAEENKIRMARAQWNQMKPMMEGYLKGFNIKTILHLPGELDAATAWEKQEDGSITRTLSGENIMETYAKLMENDDILLRGMGGGPDELLQEEAAVDILFGKSGVPHARTRGDLKSRFDYETEIVEAKKSHDALKEKFKELGVGMGRFGMGIDGPDESETLYKETDGETLLRTSIVLNMSEMRIESDPRLNEESFREHLRQCLGNSNMNVNMEVDHGSYGYSSGDDRDFVEIRIKGKTVRFFECRKNNKGDLQQLTLTAHPQKGCSIVIRDDARRCLGVLDRDAGGAVRLSLLIGGDALTGTWASLPEMLRAAPGTYRRLIELVKEFPIGVPPTPVDPKIIRTCLAWSAPLEEKIRGELTELSERLSADSIEERTGASQRLSELARDDANVLLFLFREARRAEDPERRFRMEAVLEENRGLSKAIAFADKQALHRDLGFLGSLLDMEDRNTATAVLEHLCTLTGNRFESAEAFHDWFRKEGNAVRWDEAAGRYLKE